MAASNQENEQLKKEIEQLRHDNSTMATMWYAEVAERDEKIKQRDQIILQWQEAYQSLSQRLHEAQGKEWNSERVRRDQVLAYQAIQTRDEEKLKKLQQQKEELVASVDRVVAQVDFCPSFTADLKRTRDKVMEV